MLRPTSRYSTKLDSEKTRTSDVNAILGILLFTIIGWYKTLSLTFIGESAIYLTEPYNHFINGWNIFPVIFRYDLFSLVFFKIFGESFKTNYVLYMGVLFLGIFLVAVGLYIVVKKDAGFGAGVISTVLFVVNYTSHFEIIGQGYYQWYIQRVPNIFVTLLSFYLYQKAIDENGKRNNTLYFVSIVVFAISLFMAHFSFLLLPLFIFYSIFYVVRTASWKTVIIRIGESVPYIAISAYVISREELTASESSFSEFLSEKGIALIRPIFEKVTILTFPPDVVGLFTEVPNAQIVSFFAWPTLLILMLGLVLLRGADRRNLHLALSMLATTIAVLVLSFYLKEPFLSEYTTSRYLYVPALTYYGYWGITIYTFSKKKVLFTLSTVLIGLLSFLNIVVIQQAFNDQAYKHEGHKAVTAYLRERAPHTRETLFVIPSYIGGYSAQMHDGFYAEESSNIVDDKSTRYEQLLETVQYEEVVIVDYDDGELSVNSVHFDDYK